MAEVYQGLLSQAGLGGYLYQQQAAMQNIGAIWGGSQYRITTSGTSNAFHQAINVISYDPINQVVQEQPKKKKRFITELREEIRNWHGDLRYELSH